MKNTLGLALAAASALPGRPIGAGGLPIRAASISHPSSRASGSTIPAKTDDGVASRSLSVASYLGEWNVELALQGSNHDAARRQRG